MNVSANLWVNPPPVQSHSPRLTRHPQIGAPLALPPSLSYLTILKRFCFGTDVFLAGSVAVPLSR
jgi:hypothetical protein